MNLMHRWYCSSRHWANTVHGRLPLALEGVNLGSNVLEIGPGPGITTDLLRVQVEHLTCVEVDRKLAQSLADRMAPHGVSVLHQDGTATTLPDCYFDSVVCFTMLHHIPSTELQDRLLCEVYRVLRSGGTFAGTDSRSSFTFRLLHIRDTMVVVDPSTFAQRLRAAGFVNVRIDLSPTYFRFSARRSNDN
jgi:ubiquinone/menaquinone biosynthesis C-methylase UbiE